MSFQQFNEKIKHQFELMCKTGRLFRVRMSGLDIYKLYIESFENDTIFRDPDSSEHNCNLCNNFVRRYGNIVAINEDLSITTLFDVEVDEPYQKVANTLSTVIKKYHISDVFFETFDELKSLPYEACNKTQATYRLGVDKNHKRYTKEEAEKFGVVEPNEIRTFHHFNIDLPSQFVDKSGKSVESIMGEYRDKFNVFKRGMQEISLDTLLLVKDLINQNSLLDGIAHLPVIQEFVKYKRCQVDEDNWYWVKTYEMSERLAKFRNTLIGTLCVELTQGEDLNKACENWNKRVDPVNYMKASAPITKKQIEEAKKFVQENGYEESFSRRFATIDDIKVSEIKHINIGDGKIKEVSIFDNVKSTSSQHKRQNFEDVKEISIEKFMSDVLPACTSVEVMLENKHEGNLVALTTASNEDSKPIFKWSNNYSWTYNGNLAGKSLIKQAVKAAGGKVDGVLRFSISWNEDGRSICDFDAHAIEPNNTHIYYRSYKGKRTSMSGFLDVDMIRPPKMGVENITWTDRNSMKDGKYSLFVKNFDNDRNTGFKAEVEVDGNVFLYEVSKEVWGDTPVANIIKDNGSFRVEHLLPHTDTSKTIWNLETKQFHKVNLICLSPNYWGDNNVGNKHYFFMLENCNPDISLRSFHNENLISDLLQHRKVMEILGNSTMLEPTKSLSGLGFNATVKDELIVRCKGTHNRMLKIIF